MASAYKNGHSNKLENLREDVSALADQLTSALTDKGEDVRNNVTQQVQKIRDDIEEALTGGWSATGRELMHSIGADDIGETIESNTRERPFTMLAIAAGIGMVMGSQLRR